MQWLPNDFTVPEGLESTGLRLRPLTVDDVVKDFDAVVSSRLHLRHLFGRADGWLADEHSLTQNLIDLGWHQKRHQLGEAFTYTVVTADESRVVGCVYFDPPSRAGFDAEVTFWSRGEPGLEERLERVVRGWLSTAWPFERVAFPGRDIPWDQWRSLPVNRPHRPGNPGDG